jgi:hypothetical protein
VSRCSWFAAAAVANRLARPGPPCHLAPGATHVGIILAGGSRSAGFDVDVMSLGVFGAIDLM